METKPTLVQPHLTDEVTVRTWYYRLPEAMRSAVHPEQGQSFDVDSVMIRDHGDGEPFFIACYGTVLTRKGKRYGNEYIRINDIDLVNLLTIIDAPESERGFKA